VALRLSETICCSPQQLLLPKHVGKLVPWRCAGIVGIWDTHAGRCKHTLEGPGSAVEWIDWHPRGDVVLAGSEDYTAWLWNAQSAACMQVGCDTVKAQGIVVSSTEASLQTRVVQAGCVCSLAGSSAGKCRDGCAGVHRAQRAREVRAILPRRPPGGHRWRGERCQSASVGPQVGSLRHLYTRTALPQCRWISCQATILSFFHVCCFHSVHRHQLLVAIKGACPGIFSQHIYCIATGLTTLDVHSDSATVLTGSEDGSACLTNIQSGRVLGRLAGPFAMHTHGHPKIQARTDNQPVALMTWHERGMYGG
jgi:WD40 repeat protein